MRTTIADEQSRSPKSMFETALGELERDFANPIAPSADGGEEIAEAVLGVRQLRLQLLKNRDVRLSRRSAVP